ncbi:LytTR family DNA-binding domain-containing protein [Cytophagaceae bacterium DM2B3-1]|uniref:LytTR family DNA-binding domain-containing protein n=1 Tax=Xanthocytophaga flava TaxID=3048013 RepID=A0ABT7CJD8_9BACT|nr:LytTR family DNA-binding domain-containing protein [Xanthocytophaga flavus]MDJ1467765.1 LytTR family DNA-binding domain-containing protein [Xanthocytophaga flavus]MDJ1493844.1 LytTR family DNA-binding domain-containing protein [Xanthocytophaga flavus]
MNLTCVIVEDEPLARNLLTQYIHKVSYLTLVHTCSNPMEALEFLRDNKVDILFLDIQMPEITGISLLKILQVKPLVILTTAYSEYALEGYELDVADYLLKPITFERFLKAAEKAAGRLTTPGQQQQTETLPDKPPTEPASPFIFVKDGTKLVKIRLQDILYVEGLKDYVTIHTHHQKVVSLQRLKSLEEQLPQDRFLRVHHSYIVALEGIDAIMKEKVQIGNALIPIGDTYRKSFKEFIERNHLQSD